MRTQYIARGYIAFSEQTHWDDGCFGPSKNECLSGQEWTLKADTLKGLMEKLTREFKSKDFLFDTCGDGRLDLQAYQLKPFQCSKISNGSDVKWKAGEIDLWLTCYTFHIEKVVTEFSLTEELAKEAAQCLDLLKSELTKEETK